MRDWQILSEGRRVLLEQEPGEEGEGEEEEGDEGEEEEPEAPELDPDPEPEPEPMPGTASEDSLDNQIDALLIGFEKDSVEQQNEWSGFSKKSHFRSMMSERRRRKGRTLWEAFGALLEAEGDEDEETTDNAEVEDMKPENPDRPPLNLDHFAQRVARLVNNYETMLDVPAAIVDRATRFIADNYDGDTADQFEEILATQHDIQTEEDPEEYPAYGPPAYGAEGIPSATGGLGGGDAGDL